MLLTIFGQSIAYLFTFFLGYFLLSLLMKKEGGAMYRGEFWTYSLLLGVVSVAFVLFILSWIGVPLSFFPILITLVSLIGVLFFFFQKNKQKLEYKKYHSEKFSPLQKILLLVFGIFVSLKCLFGLADILSVPTYQDDTFGNWNMRAKVFYEREGLVLDKTDSEFLGTGYRQYPLTPSLFKTYLAIFSPGWSEGAINLPSFLFFLTALSLIFFITLGITGDTFLSWVAVYITTSIPIYFIHGTNPYFDGFQSVYFLSALSFLFLFARGEVAWIPVGVMLGILGYTKSEGLIIYMTAAFFTVSLLFLFQKHFKKHIKSLFLIGLLMIGINLPFIIFKLYYGLGFGNGDASVTSTELTFHTEIFSPLYQAIFHWGNYGMFPLLFLFAGLIFVLRKGIPASLRSSEMIFLLGGWIAFSMILFVYLTTFTFAYVMDQTGINRSIVQMIPVFVVQFMIFIHFLRHAR